MRGQIRFSSTIRLAVLLALFLIVATNSYGEQINVRQADKPPTMYTLLNKKYPQKSEFETSSAYLERISAPQNELLLLYGEDRLFQMHTCYNADEQVLRVAFTAQGHGLARASTSATTQTSPRKNRQYSPSYEQMTLQLSSDSKSLGSAPGQNAYGAKVTIKYTQISTYEINIINWNEVSKIVETSPILHTTQNSSSCMIYKYIPLKIDPIQAQQLKSTIGVAIVAQPTAAGSPVAVTYTRDEYSGATISSPISASFKAYGINVLVKKISIYNKKDGTIISSFQFSADDSH